MLTKPIYAVRSWLKEESYRRLMLNVSWLSAASVLSSIFGLLSITIAARGLGPENLGVLILIISYASIIDKLLNFQSWQFLIKNGAEALSHNNYDRLKYQIKFSTLLDVGSSLASTFFAISIVGVIGEIIGWTKTETVFAMAYCVTILFHISGMPTGILRLFDKFNILAFHKIGAAAICFFSVLFAWTIGGELHHYLLAFGLSSIIGNMILATTAWLQLRKQGIKGVWASSLSGLAAKEPGIWRFVILTNIESSVKIIRDLDIFLIKITLSAEAVGIYTLARKFSEALHMLIDPFFHAIYPELSRLVSKRDLRSIQKVVTQSSISIGVAAVSGWILFLIFGDWVINIIFGPSYAATYAIAAICMLGSVIWAFSQAATPVLYNLGKSLDVLVIHIATAIFYIATLAILSQILGMIGAAISYVAFFLAWGIISAATTLHRIKTFNWKLA